MSGLGAAEQLVEIEAIKRLKALQSRAIDTKDWATYLAVHADHHVSYIDRPEPWVGAPYEKRGGRWVFTSRRLERTKVLATPGASLG